MNKKLILLSLITIEFLFAETLSVITVDANQSTDSTSISATKIDRTKIDNTVQGNGFISSLMDTNPNIEVKDDSLNSTTAGEIAPGKISINEAPFYQNNFQIDGVSNDSLLDPSLSNVRDPYDVPGNENAVFIDLDLIESVTVYDSNISAEYGGFTGGVIDAKTIRGNGKPSFKLSYGHTSDSLTEFHVRDKEDFEKARSDNQQPRFKKNFLSMYATTPIDDENAIIFSYNRKESIIPGAYFGGFVDKERLNESIFGKWSHFFEDDSVLDVSATYSPYESTHIQEYTRDSHTTIKGGGFNLKGNYEKDFNFWNLKSNLAFTYSENSKESLNYNKAWLNKGDKTWGASDKNFSYEGGTGNIDKSQKGVAYNLKLKSNEFKTFDISHTLKTGLTLNYDIGAYDRKDNMYFYLDAKNNSAVDCNGDTEGCSYSDQYFEERRVYDAHKLDVSMVSTALYFEDKLKYKNFEITPGIRFDYNNYLKNKDVSYRINSTFKPFNNDKTVIFGGFNRYYGKSFLGFKLREARIPYYDQYRTTYGNIAQDWGTSADKDISKYIFSDLETPYTDEASIGIKQDLFGARINLKYVNRKARNKFTKQKGELKRFKKYDNEFGSPVYGYFRPTSFTNDGYSDSDIVSLSISPTEPVKFNSFDLGYSFSTSWKKTTSNSDTYEDIIDEEGDDSNKAYYNGKFYDEDDLPIESDPKNINIHLNMAFKPINLFGVPTKINLNNVIRYNLAYSDIFVSDDGNTKDYSIKFPDGSSKNYPVPVYEKVDFKDAVTFDLKANFDFNLSGKHHFVFNTEITNIFDKVQNVESSRSNYKTGRQFWFNASYKF